MNRYTHIVITYIIVKKTYGRKSEDKRQQCNVHLGFVITVSVQLEIEYNSQETLDHPTKIQRRHDWECV